MKVKAFGIVPVILLLLFLTPGTGFTALTETEVSESLICYACPGEPLNIDRCSGGDRMRAVISKMLKEGKGKQEILDVFVAQFGDSILTTVPKKGFNLVAYTGPFVGLLVGIPLALLIIRRWGSAGRKQTEESGIAVRTATLDDQTRLQVEKELSKFEEEE